MDLYALRRSCSIPVPEKLRNLTRRIVQVAKIRAVAEGFYTDGIFAGLTLSIQNCICHFTQLK